MAARRHVDLCRELDAEFADMKESMRRGRPMSLFDSDAGRQKCLYAEKDPQMLPLYCKLCEIQKDWDNATNWSLEWWQSESANLPACMDLQRKLLLLSGPNLLKLVHDLYDEQPNKDKMLHWAEIDVDSPVMSIDLYAIVHDPLLSSSLYPRLYNILWKCPPAMVSGDRAVFVRTPCGIGRVTSPQSYADHHDVVMFCSMHSMNARHNFEHGGMNEASSARRERFFRNLWRHMRMHEDSTYKDAHIEHVKEEGDIGFYVLFADGELRAYQKMTSQMHLADVTDEEWPTKYAVGMLGIYWYICTHLPGIIGNFDNATRQLFGRNQGAQTAKLNKLLEEVQLLCYQPIQKPTINAYRPPGASSLVEQACSWWRKHNMASKMHLIEAINGVDSDDDDGNESDGNESDWSVTQLSTDDEQDQRPGETTWLQIPDDLLQLIVDSVSLDSLPRVSLVDQNWRRFASSDGFFGRLHVIKEFMQNLMAAPWFFSWKELTDSHSLNLGDYIGDVLRIGYDIEVLTLGIECGALANLKELCVDYTCHTLTSLTAVILPICNTLAKGFLPNLITLHCSGCKIGDLGLQVIAMAAGKGAFKNLGCLSLRGNRIGDNGVRSFVDSLCIGAFAKLTILDLSDNQIGCVGLAGLAEACDKERALKECTSLYLNDNRFGEEGCDALASAVASGAMPLLRSLNIGPNKGRISIPHSMTAFRRFVT
jgi:hypothetical protein